MSGALWDRVAVPPESDAVVRRIEAFRSHPYADSGGVWTIAFGNTHDAAGGPVTPMTPAVTFAQGEALLLRDMQSAAADVAREVTVDLRDCEAAALISWTYNLGEGNLAISTMLRRVNEGDKPGAAAAMREWINAGGRPLLGLLRRRWAEAAIFLGMAPDDACTLAWSTITALGQWPALG